MKTQFNSKPVNTFQDQCNAQHDINLQGYWESKQYVKPAHKAVKKFSVSPIAVCLVMALPLITLIIR